MEFGDKGCPFERVYWKKIDGVFHVVLLLGRVEEGFLPAIQPVCEIIVQLLEFYFHEREKGSDNSYGYHPGEKMRGEKISLNVL